MRCAVVLLSGGLDSYTAAAIARAEGFRLFALTIRYGQRHARELEAARAVAGCARRRAAHRARRRPVGVRRLVADHRRAGAEGSPARYQRASRRPTCPHATRSSSRSRWPGRRRSAPRDIFIGVNALDYSGYPDCRPEFIAAFERLASLATAQGVGGARIPHPCAAAAPDARPRSFAKGPALGLDYGLTHSCYDPDPAGRPCGRCDSCTLRAAGFAQAGIADPAFWPIIRRDRC